MQRHYFQSVATFLAIVFCLCLGQFLGPQGVARSAEPLLELHKGDRIAFIGNTLADRMQHSAWLETYIYALYPELAS